MHHMVGTYICRYMQGPCGAAEEHMEMVISSMDTPPLCN